MPIIECIPNFSEGSKIETLREIAKAIQSVKGLKLLHQDSGVAANRTVFTYAGEVDAVFEATYKAIQVASKSIDMRIQQGEHPRIGACDVCPFVPISGITMNELVAKVNYFAEKVSNDLDIPVFLYEQSAKSDDRRNLARHRVGDYEQLQNRITTKSWLPDFGKFNATTGGTVMGARNFLVAYNINLNTKDAKIAQDIAYDLRELGRPIGKESGRMIYRPGKLQKVKAIGWYIKDFNIAQVSINLTDYKITSLYEVFETTKLLAEKYGVRVTGSELIGLLPKSSLLETGELYAKNQTMPEQEYIQLAVNKLGLSNLLPFEPNLRILEYVMNA
ncbi:MAG: glutamate formiminotransferase/formiminotetrahydrofolate cyclodeaminase [Vicingaceae bacterium]|jgi:glutamate formiminotransferase/formiminotetrahydrofolate cyclodeaminase